MKNDQDIPLLKEFGHRIKELRDAKCMTQEDLADAAGLFRTYLSRIETGMANPSLTVLHALARALGEPVTVLFSPLQLLKPPQRTVSTKNISRGRVR